MITNERQLQVSKARADEFQAAIDEFNGDEGAKEGLHPALQDAQRQALVSQRDELLAEIAAYARLRSGEVRSFTISSLSELPRALIDARIAAGLNQRDLAARLGLKEQQIQRYEAQRYEGASFTRIADVADAIGVEIPGHIQVLRATSPDAVIKRVRAAGVDDDLLARRIAPALGEAAPSINILSDRLETLFGWSPAAITSNEALMLPGEGGRSARYKLPKGRDARSVAGYTAYAHGLARICAEAMRDARRREVPVDWAKFRDLVVHQKGKLTFETVLDAAWDMGVVILPLGDGGAFHGACWRINNVNVVVLKQSTLAVARWLHDLLHELFHAGQRPDEAEFQVVEAPETSEERRSDPEERRATWFASQVALAGRSEELFAMAMAAADHDLRSLKRAIIQVARKERADVGSLANYAAFRLSLQGENWWGAAQNLQDVAHDPLRAARDRFFERFDFSGLDGARLDLITLALSDEVPNG